MAPGPASDPPDLPSVELVLDGRAREVAGFPVRRVLPQRVRRSLGPFVFLDHLGPHKGDELAPGDGMEVGPHPHIGLATVTYLLDGELLHRDSLGSAQVIRAGDVNWMIAGRGVAHSERSTPEARARGGCTHGVQTWVALPRDREDMAPAFEHHPASTLPVVVRPGVTLRVIAGNAYGVTAPTRVLAPTLYVHATFERGATLALDDGHRARGVYVVDGELELAGRTFGGATLAVVRPEAAVTLHARTAANVMLVGGAPLDGPRHMWWNFVSTSKDRIEQAKTDWRDGRFAEVAGDLGERVPLPAG